MRHVFSRLRLTLMAVLALLPVLAGDVARAGCGCEKPPPPPAAVRPAVTWPGRDVTLFHASLVVGESYQVRFVPSPAGGSKELSATAVLRRDLADGVPRPQLVLPLPELPLGPARIEVRAGGAAPLLVVPDDAFTVAPPPIPILTHVDRYEFRNVRGAVGRDGVVYVSLDFSDILQARIFRAQALGYPLRFSHDDLAFWNVQGFLMQLLGTRMPGLYSLAAGSGTDSDRLQYSRHEFHTHLLAHGERASHTLDPDDANWHLDGTPHIDHDHQILAIAGELANGAQPAPGATPSFDLVVETFTLFHHGLFADVKVEVTGRAAVDSYHSGTGELGSAGDVRSNGNVRIDDDASVAGNVAGDSVEIEGTVSGTVIEGAPSEEMLLVDVPAAAVALGKLEVKNDDTRILGPGSYVASELIVGSDAQLLIDNLTGPVTLYVTGKVDVSTTLGIVTTALDPESFAVYVAGDEDVKVSNNATFHGVVYAPEAKVEVAGGGEFFGAFVGREVKITGDSLVHYDEALREGETVGAEAPAQLHIRRARHGRRSGRLQVVARSSENAAVPLVVTIEGVATDAPMRWKPKSRRWVYEDRVAADLEGVTVSVRGMDGSVGFATLR